MVSKGGGTMFKKNFSYSRWMRNVELHDYNPNSDKIIYRSCLFCIILPKNIEKLYHIINYIFRAYFKCFRAGGPILPPVFL